MRGRVILFVVALGFLEGGGGRPGLDGRGKVHRDPPPRREY